MPVFPEVTTFKIYPQIFLYSSAYVAAQLENPFTLQYMEKGMWFSIKVVNNVSYLVNEPLNPNKSHSDMVTIDIVNEAIPAQNGTIDTILSYSHILSWLNGDDRYTLWGTLDPFGATIGEGADSSKIYKELTDQIMLDNSGNPIPESRACIVPYIATDSTKVPIRMRFFCRIAYTVNESQVEQSFPINTNEVFETVFNAQQPYMFLEEFIDTLSRSREYMDSSIRFFDSDGTELVPATNTIHSPTRMIYAVLTTSILGSGSNLNMMEHSNVEQIIVGNGQDIASMSPYSIPEPITAECGMMYDEWTLLIPDEFEKENNENGYLSIFASFVKRKCYLIDLSMFRRIEQYIRESYLTYNGFEYNNMDIFGLSYETTVFFDAEIPLAYLPTTVVTLNSDVAADLVVVIETSPEIEIDYTSVTRTVEITGVYLRDTNYNEYHIDVVKDISSSCLELYHVTWSYLANGWSAQDWILQNSLSLQTILDLYATEISQLAGSPEIICASVDFDVTYNGSLGITPVEVVATDVRAVLGAGYEAFGYAQNDFTLVTETSSGKWSASKFGIVLPAVPRPSHACSSNIITSLKILPGFVSIMYPTTGNTIYSNNSPKVLYQSSVISIDNINCKVIDEYSSGRGVSNISAKDFSSGTIIPSVKICRSINTSDIINIYFDERSVTGSIAPQYGITEIPSATEVDDTSEFGIEYIGGEQEV